MQGKGKSIYMNRAQHDLKRRRQLRNWAILIAVVVAVFVALRLLQSVGTTREITVTQLPCYATQSITPFGQDVLYYDGASIHCLSGSGGIRWSYPVGGSASFTVSDTHLVIWQGSQLYIVDKNGNPTYNESLAAEIQFARVGNRYVAVIIGEDTAPELLVKDLTGAQVDEESDAFQTLLMLDCGFYGDDGQYLWTLAMDVFGTKANTILNTFQVGKMNTGEVSLGDSITYKVLFENNKLRVFNTRQLYTYDYKLVQDTNATMLVYGWKLIDDYIPAKGDAGCSWRPRPDQHRQRHQRAAPAQRAAWTAAIPCPRIAWARRCMKTAIYAFSDTYLYKTDINTQQFYAYEIPVAKESPVTQFLGLLGGEQAVIACGESVYSVTLPN